MVEKGDSKNEFSDSSDDDSVIEKASVVKVTKKGIPKKPYVLTDARKAAFEKAKKIREEKLAVIRSSKEVEAKELSELKEHLKAKKDLKVIKKQKEELAALDTSSDEEVRVRKHKKHK